MFFVGKYQKKAGGTLITENTSLKYTLKRECLNQFPANQYNDNQLQYKSYPGIYHE